MKRSIVVTVLVVAMGLFIAGGAYAWWGGGYGMGYGTGTNVETMKKFQSETLSLRDAIMTKNLELQNEYNKPAPDANRIATLHKEIIDLQAKIHAVAEKHGITAGGATRGHMGGMMMGRGMMGPGMMMDMCPMMGW